MQVIFKKILSIVLVLLITCSITLGFAGLASAGDLNSARKLFDTYESKAKNWNYGYTNDQGGVGWGEAVVMRAYLGMYEATGDKVYLDKFVFHGDKLLDMRDSVRGVTDYRGLSLSAWRAGERYNRAGKYYIYAVHTGMTAYPYAEFARIVYNNSNLSSYKKKADIYLQAAKDAVAIHKDDWVNDGEFGYYIDQKGSPSNSDGVPLPFNQYLAMARAELVLYLVTGDELYLDHATRMAKHFKSHLTVDQSTGAYFWYYWYGLGYNGWKASDNVSVNTPSYGGFKTPEDFSHGVIDVDFAHMAYRAGIVFTEDDMRRFGLTIEKKMLRSDGSVEQLVSGALTVPDSSHPSIIGQWLRYYKYAPSLAPAFEKLVAPLSAVPAGTFNAVAMFAQMYSGTLDYSVTPILSPQTPPVEPPKGEIVVNGDFSQGATGWKDQGGSMKTEASGNQYRSQTALQGFYQLVQVPAGDYTLSVAARKGTATGAKIIVGFYDTGGKYTIGNDVTYQFQGNGWESVPAITVKVPAGTSKVRITLFAGGDTGEAVDFDNVSFKAGTQPTDPPPVNTDTTAPTAQVTAPGANNVVKGNITLTAQASDNVKVIEVTFEFNPPEGGQWAAVGPATEKDGAWSVKWDTIGVADGAYNVRAVAQDAASNKGASDIVAITIDNTKPVVGPSPLGSYNLQQSGTVTVNYTLSEDATVTVAIHDSAGSLTNTLANGASKAEGSQQVIWDGKNSAGTPVNPGSYTIKITAVDKAGNSSDPVTGTIRLQSDAEFIVNGNFSQKATGWKDNGGSIKTESNGNEYRSQTALQGFYQLFQAPAGDYTLNVAARKGTAKAARIIVGFYGSGGEYTIGNDVTYQFQGNGWESVPAFPVKVPAGTSKVRITLFAGGDTNETVDFDNVSLKEGTRPTNPPPADPPGEVIVNGDFSQGATGWSDIGGSFKTDSNGNGYRSQTYSQGFYQVIDSIAAGQYGLNLQTRRGRAAAPARIIVGCYDGSGKYTILKDVTYQYKSSSWENVPEILFSVPAEAKRLRITLFSGSSSVPVDFDNVSLKKK